MDLNCRINFLDNPLVVYYAGQEIKGTVDLELQTPIKFQGISMVLHGCAKVYWEQSTIYELLGDESRGKKKYSNFEEYITKQKYIEGPHESGSAPFYPVGSHKFDFNFELTDNLPCSFEGAHGYVRYTLKVILERPWDFDLKYKLTFTVLKQSDLNSASPDLRIPMRVDTVKNFCLWPCQSEALKISVTLPISGFVPGQVMPISVLVDNVSTVEIEKFELKLKKVISYHAEHPEFKVRREKFVVAQKDATGVAARQKKLLQHKIKIPAGPPTNFGYCKAIGIAYELDVVAITPQMHQNVKLKCPITVGTIPLAPENIFSMQSLNMLTNTAGSQTRAVTNGSSLPPAYSDVVSVTESLDPNEPPLYEASMDVRVSIRDTPEDHEDTIDPIEYSPRYPVYRFNIIEVINASKQTLNDDTVDTRV